MRITVLLLLASIFQTFANDAYSQKTRLSLDLSGIALEDALGEIEELSEFFFLYNAKFVDTERKVTLSVQKQKIEEILDELFIDTDISYTITDRRIILAPSFLSDNLQQQKSIYGVVTDITGQPLPGVTVVIKGSIQGTVTDADGNYSLSDVTSDAMLIFSFVGMKTQEISAAGKTSINVTMAEESIGIDEVVAIGYGTQKRGSITGAIASMKSEEVENIPVSNLSNSLAGRISGVYVTQASGAPGYAEDIRIRAVNTWKSSGNEPLYVIDGIISGKRAFNALDYSEVDIITVLKDAASGAIYGARAANGVILVTTKTGKVGKFQLNYNYSYSLDNPSQLPDHVDTRDMVRLENYAATSQGLPPVFDAEEVAYFNQNDPGRDWYKLAYKDPVLQKHTLTASGGSEKIKYFAAGSYFDQTAFIKNADYKKYNFRSNINANFTKNLSGIINVSYSQATRERFVMSDQDGDGFNVKPNFGGLWSRLISYLPTVPPKTSDGKYINPGWLGNPLAFIEGGGTNTRVERNINTLFGLTYKVPFVEGLSVSGRFNQNYQGTTIKQYEIKPTLYNVKRIGTNQQIYTNEIIGTSNSPSPNKERLARIQEATKNYQLNFSVNYSKKIGKHNVDAVLVYEQSEGNYDYFYGVREGFPLVHKDQFWATSSSRNDSYVNGREREYGRASYIGRVAYNYDDKYFATITTRRDGSMLFAPDSRWGTFPSVSAGWIVSKEDFFNVGAVDYLKLRGSWGLTGNDAVGGWEWSESFSANGDYLMGTSLVNRIKYDGIINPDLTWEKTREWNIGIDSRLFEGFLFNAEYYRRHNSDILASRILSLPTSFGGNMPPVNYGEVDAHGYELELGYIGNIGEVKYAVKGNFAYATNKVVSRDVEENVRDYNDPNGRPTDYIKMLVSTDIIRTQADLDALPDGYTIYGLQPKLGAINFEDVSGPEEGVPDGKIDSYDKQIIKGKHFIAPYTYGLNLNANWKGFGVDVFLQGITGVSKLFDDGNRRGVTGGNSRSPSFWLDSWSEDNVDAEYPKPVTWNQSMDHKASTFWLKDGSYLRLQNVSLTYSLPEIICEKINISDVTFILSGTNLLTLSKFDYYDPSVAKLSSYPTMKTYTMGINVKF